MRILVTRPEPDATVFADKVRELGHDTVVAPLSSIRFARGQLPLNGIQALVVTSRNALRALAGNPSLPKAVAIPVFTVGPGSGASAAELGFERIVAGTASARELVEVIVQRGEPSGRPPLVLRGDQQAFDIKTALEEKGFSVNARIIYRTRPVEDLGELVAEGIRSGAIDGVILMSPKTAEIFMDLLNGAGLADRAQHLFYFCLSGAVAQKLGPVPSVNVFVASAPNSEEMLALVGRMAAKSH